MAEKVDITIIGAGVVGCALAYTLAKGEGSNRDIAVIEKNRQVNGENQSSRNSGVIHAGVYYPRSAGPLKARLCVEGNRILYDFCRTHDIPHKKCGKIIVATDSLEEEYLVDVYHTAKDNGVPGIEIIDSQGIKRLEPNVRGTAALYVPTSGVVEATSLVNRLFDLAEGYGVMFLTGNEVTGIRPGKDMFEVDISSDRSSETFHTGLLINSAGLFSDEIAKMANPSSRYSMDPVKGESAKFYSGSREELKMNGLNVYPVPFGYLPDGSRMRVSFSRFKKKFDRGEITKSVGVHLTPAFDYSGGRPVIGSTVTLGPAYSVPRDKDDYTSTRDAGYFFSMVKPFFPGIRREDITLHQTGIRSRLSGYYDFVIERDPQYNNLINLMGIDSPGLTSCLAIAEYVSKLIH